MSCSSDNDQLGPSMASDASGLRQASKDPSSAYGAPAIARLSEDVASTSVLSATHGIPLSLSNISLYRDDSVRLLLACQDTSSFTPFSDASLGQFSWAAMYAQSRLMSCQPQGPSVLHFGAARNGVPRISQ